MTLYLELRRGAAPEERPLTVFPVKPQHAATSRSGRRYVEACVLSASPLPPKGHLTIVFGGRPTHSVAYDGIPAAPGAPGALGDPDHPWVLFGAPGAPYAVQMLLARERAPAGAPGPAAYRPARVLLFVPGTIAGALRPETPVATDVGWRRGEAVTIQSVLGI